MVGKGRPKDLARHVKTNRAFRAYIDLMDAADWLRGEMSDQSGVVWSTMMQVRVLGSAWKRSTFRSDIAQGWVYIMHNQEAAQWCPKDNRIPGKAFLSTSPKQSTLIGYGNWWSHFTENQKKHHLHNSK
jgi:hypothetical protein